jgi:hypothetical protein
MNSILNSLLSTLKGTNPAAWCVAAMSLLSHICIRNQVTREEFTTMCQRAFDDADKAISTLKPN